MAHIKKIMMKNLQIPLFYNYHFKFERLRKKGCYTNIYCFVYSFYLFHNSYFTSFHIKIFKTRLLFFRQRLLSFFFQINQSIISPYERNNNRSIDNETIHKPVHAQAGRVK